MKQPCQNTLNDISDIKIKEDRSDELGQLVKSFNSMAERLQKSIAEIKESEQRSWLMVLLEILYNFLRDSL